MLLVPGSGRCGLRGLQALFQGEHSLEIVSQEAVFHELVH